MKRKPENTNQDLSEQTPKRPMYVQIAENLRAGIISGQHRSGAKLPSEAELVRKFSVSRMTVVKAILRALGVQQQA